MRGGENVQTAVLIGVALLGLRSAAAYIRRKRLITKKQRRRELKRHNEAYKLHFDREMEAIEAWLTTPEPRRNNRQNIICKDPRFAAAWE